jgi:hypothetical protein
MFLPRYPWESPRENALEPTALPLPAGSAPPPKRRGRRPAAPQWLYHHLTVTGPAGTLAAFAAAARGSGVIPWQIDAGRIEAQRPA